MPAEIHGHRLDALSARTICVDHTRRPENLWKSVTFVVRYSAATLAGVSLLLIMVALRAD